MFIKPVCRKLTCPNLEDKKRIYLIYKRSKAENDEFSQRSALKPHMRYRWSPWGPGLNSSRYIFGGRPRLGLTSLICAVLFFRFARRSMTQRLGIPPRREYSNDKSITKYSFLFTATFDLSGSRNLPTKVVASTKIKVPTSKQNV